MDTNRAEKVLAEFEHEVKNIVQLSSLIKSVELLNHDLSTAVTEQNKSSILLDGVAKKLHTLAEDISSKIVSNESALEDGLSVVSESLKNGLSENLLVLQTQSVKLEQILKAELHLALTRYETFVRGELISLKERIELNSKDSQQKNSEGFSEVIKIVTSNQTNLNKKINFLFICFGVIACMVGYLLRLMLS